MKLLQKYVFIPLDIFKETRHNKDIRNETDVRPEPELDTSKNIKNFIRI